MRRINRAYDEDDLYDDYDDYDEDYYDEEEEAAILAQYSRPPPPAESLVPPSSSTTSNESEVFARFAVGNSGPKSKNKASNKGKKGQSEKDNKDAFKIIEISQLVPGASNQLIRDALQDANGDTQVAVNALLEQLADSVKLSDTSKETSSTNPVVVSIPAAEKVSQTTTTTTNSSEVQETNTKDKRENKEKKKYKEKSRGKRSGNVRQPRAHVSYTTKTLKEQGIVEEETSEEKPNVNLVVVGHVDAGKSTLMGHVLYKLKYVTQREMHKFEKQSREIGKGSFAFAWVLDEHEEERERGVTVDVGVKYFETEHRTVTLLDAPGHRDFIPNMITGAVQGDVAILVVPANPGEFESTFERNGQTKEHALLVRYCGIRRLIVAVNKMDMCDWSQSRFEEIVASLKAFLLQGGYDEQDLVFLPVSGLQGDNLVEPLPAGKADWFKGPSLCQVIDSVEPAKRPVEKPLRMVVVDVFKTILLGPITASGKIEAGVIKEGQSVLVAPSNQLAKVKAIQRHRGKEVIPAKYAKAGENVDVGLTGIEDTMISGSSIICDAKQPIPVLSHFTVQITTFNELAVPLLNGTQVNLHIQSFNVPATITKLVSVEQGDGKPPKQNPRFVRKNQTATLDVKTDTPVCVERYSDYRPLARVMLRQNGVTIAAGRVTELLS